MKNSLPELTIVFAAIARDCSAWARRNAVDAPPSGQCPRPIFHRPTTDRVLNWLELLGYCLAFVDRTEQYEGAEQKCVCALRTAARKQRGRSHLVEYLKRAGTFETHVL